MSTSAAVPGPLQMENDYIATVRRGKEFPDGPAVQFFWNQDGPIIDGEEGERYRRLFLAAPDLLAALCELTTWLVNWMPDDATTQGGYDVLWTARAAIAKARGDATTEDRASTQ